jgi:hypothetical protein
MSWRHKGKYRYSCNILGLGTWWRWVVSFMPCRFKPGESGPGTHWIGGWVSPTAGLHGVEKRQILHCQESKPDRPARNPSLYRLSYHKMFLMTDISKPLQKKTYTVSAKIFKTESPTSRLNGYHSRFALRRSLIQNSARRPAILTWVFRAFL